LYTKERAIVSDRKNGTRKLVDYRSRTAAERTRTTAIDEDPTAGRQAALAGDE